VVDFVGDDPGRPLPCLQVHGNPREVLKAHADGRRAPDQGTDPRDGEAPLQPVGDRAFLCYDPGVHEDEGFSALLLRHCNPERDPNLRCSDTGGPVVTQGIQEIGGQLAKGGREVRHLTGRRGEVVRVTGRASMANLEKGEDGHSAGGEGYGGKKEITR
jgi:hypothetical protein